MDKRRGEDKRGDRTRGGERIREGGRRIRGWGRRRRRNIIA